MKYRYTVFPPIAACGAYFFSEVSDPAIIGDAALIGDGVSRVKDPALIFSASSQTRRLLEGALIGGTGGY